MNTEMNWILRQKHIVGRSVLFSDACLTVIILEYFIKLK